MRAIPMGASGSGYSGDPPDKRPPAANGLRCRTNGLRAKPRRGTVCGHSTQFMSLRLVALFSSAVALLAGCNQSDTESVTKNTAFVAGAAVDGKVGAPPNRGQIANAGQLVLGAPFHDEDLTHAKEGMTHLLEANGLYQSQVTPSVERSQDGQQVFITFKVNEGKRAKYDMPAIHGETKLPENTILRATGWRIPIIHWWRQVTDARTRNGVQGVLGRYAKDDRLAARVELENLEYDATQIGR